jgi:anti-anti-sigma factor
VNRRTHCRIRTPKSGDELSMAYGRADAKCDGHTSTRSGLLGAFSYTTSGDGNEMIVALQGEIDLASAGDLRELLLDALAQATEVLVDLSGVGFIDSSGVGALIAADAYTRGNGSTIALRGLSDAARRVIEILGLEHTLTIRA